VRSLVIFIQDIPGSEFGTDTGHPKAFYFILQSLEENAGRMR
jgi:hypothetical protein